MHRRVFLAGAASLIAAPAIVRAESLMKIVMPKPTLMYAGPMTAAEVQYRHNLWADRFVNMYQQLVSDQICYGMSITDRHGFRVDPLSVNFRPDGSCTVVKSRLYAYDPPS